jgi:tetratricopeptide (TPR) repeat protein
VGRTQYLLGQYPQAQKTLEQAFAQPKNNDLANLYLGLTLVRMGDRQKGLKDIEVGMNGIAQFVNYVTEAFRYNIRAFWIRGMRYVMPFKGLSARPPGIISIGNSSLPTENG